MNKVFFSIALLCATSSLFANDIKTQGQNADEVVASSFGNSLAWTKQDKNKCKTQYASSVELVKKCQEAYQQTIEAMNKPMPQTKQ